MKLTLILIFVLTASMLLALSGNFTVGGSNPDYTTLTEAITAANTEGLSGNVQFSLRPGTYNGAYVLQNTANTFNLTITSGTYSPSEVILTNPGSNATDNYIFKIDARTNVSLLGLTFLGSGTYSRALWIEGDSNYLNFSNNIFQGVQGTVNSNNEAIVFHSSGSETGDADNVTISTNQFYNGGYHVYINSGSYNDNYNNWLISGNTHSGGYTGLYILRASDLTITGETYTGLTNKAIELSSTTGDIEVSRNLVSNCASGISLNGCTAGNTSIPHVYNNIISVNGYVGLNVYGWGINVYHNSVLNTAGESYNRCGASFSGTDLQVRKNHIVCLGAAIPVYAQNVNPTVAHHNIIEHNNIYTNFTDVVKVSNDTYNDIADFNTYAEVENESLNPYFSTDYLHTESPWMDNLYPSCGVAIDYSGNPRSLSNSDIGAYEYTSNPALTPLSGTYTVGTGGAFTSINAFINAACLRGLAGNTTGNLTDASYAEQIVLGTIPGSAGNRTFKLQSVYPEGSVITNPDQSANDNYVFKLNRVSNVTLDLLKFQSDQPTYSNLVYLNGLNKNLNFYYCNFDAPANTSGCSIANPYYSYSNDVSVSGCIFTGNGYGVEGRGSDWDVSGCLFTNPYQAVFMQTIDNSSIQNNVINNARSYAINVNGGTAVTVFNNRITGVADGIYMGAGTYSEGTRNLVANNTVNLSPGNGSDGITLSGNGINTINNSVWATGYIAKALYCYQLGSDNDIVNNIFAVDQGYAVEVSYFTPAANIVVDYNCYYNEGSAFVKFGSVYNNLSALQAAIPGNNQHSVSINPHYTEDMHTESPWLRHAGVIRGEALTDMDGEPRGTYFDIGADQQTGTIVDNRLAGAYSVGTIGNDFLTMEEAIAAIELYGISANVTINITLGTYTGYYTLHDYPKANQNLGINFVAWEGSNFVLSPTFDQTEQNFFFHLVGADNLSFSGFNLSQSGENKRCSYFVMDGRCDKITITDCNFALAGPVNNNYNIGINTLSSEGSNFTVSDCVFTYGSTGLVITGSYYGSLSYDHVIVNGCTFTNTNYPLSLQKTPDLWITNNQFTNNITAVSLTYVSGYSLIKDNKICAYGYSGGFSSGTCMNLYNLTGTAEDPIQIVNNIIYADQSSAQSVTALNIGYSSYVLVDHNTAISDNSTYNDYGSALSLANVSYSTFSNSIFSAPTSGYSVVLGGCSELEFYSNAYYSSARYLGKIASTTYTHDEFITTQLGDLYGIFADPLPDANGYTQCTYLRDKGNYSATSLDIDGNSFGNPSDMGATVVPNYGDPLSGVISVGVGMQFSTLELALDALEKRGISGDVRVEVAGGEQSLSATLGYIPNSLTNNVTIIAASEANAPVFVKTASTEADNYILRLHNTSNLRLAYLGFRMTNPSAAKCLDVQRFTRNIDIDSCSFGTAVNTLSNTNSSAIYAYDAIFEGFRIQYCNINYNPTGAYIYGLSSQASLNTGFEFVLNTVANTFYGLYSAYLAAPEVIANDFNNARNIGIWASYSSDIQISGNTITGSSSRGLALSYLGASSGVHRVFNNYITTAPQCQNTVILENSANVQFYYNTLISTSTYANSYAFGQSSSCSGLAFQNNICKAATGYAASFNQLADLSSWDHNLYYSAGSNVVKLGTTVINSSLAWNQNTGDQYSIFADPLLDGDTYNLTAGSPARNAGINIPGIITDIDGNYRDITDIGCMEYVLLVLDTPENIGISVDSATQTVTLSWSTVAGAGAYRVQTANDPYASVWTNVTGGITGQLSITLPLNAVGKFFRIVAIGS
ncbi:MAG: hypothetical protein CVU50_07785 [Candidatus Cloacimonetes bacterium HGW-Cloacimonetes-3]|jgi:hypothetical protein|nr:MAG: hypothetical protein CVU50_07785 [Candidatus Cloacimonetes bacterium HGW-Cloacimonetes-3]